MDATELRSSDSGEIRIRKEAARAFSVVGIVSIGLGLVVLVFSSLPVRLMDPVWQLQFSGALAAAGFSLLIGTLLVCTAGALPVSPPPIHANVKLLRGICTWVAILYLALIPIQLYAGVRVLQQKASEEGRGQASWRRFKKQLERHHLIILDELGYVPFTKSGAELLFDVVSRAYERTSLIVTTNLPF